MNFIQTLSGREKIECCLRLRRSNYFAPDFTDRLELLDRAVFAHQENRREDRALRCGLANSVMKKMRSAQGRRALVIITDGVDNVQAAPTSTTRIDIAQRNRNLLCSRFPRRPDCWARAGS